jgi:hypothetical protein
MKKAKILLKDSNYVKSTSLLYGLHDSSFEHSVADAQVHNSGERYRKRWQRPVIGASVLVKAVRPPNHYRHKWKLHIAGTANATLVISFVGYKTQEVAVAGKSTLANYY